ncbi:AsmA family protein, partial [Zoogloea sp.]|uniref:AsmA family protein n=1 Tax=Zoogloea sp. TaxID=49181 RepID=UPI001416BDE4
MNDVHPDGRPSRHPGRWFAVSSLVVVGVALFQWNLLRGPINSLVSARLERGFRIAGDLEISPWSMQPSLSAMDVQLDNAAWGKAPRMLSVKRVRASVDLTRLLRGELVLPVLEIDTPRISLEEDAKGRGNWLFGGTDKAAAGPHLRIATLTIVGGELEAVLPSRQADLRASFSTDAATGHLRFASTGRWRGQAMQFDGQAGSLLDLDPPERPYPVSIKGNVGATRLALSGQVSNLLAMAGMDVRFSLSGRSLAELYPLTGVPLPATPPYQLSASLVRKSEEWVFSGIDGRIGRSDVGGTLTVDRSRPLQQIRGALRSRRIDISDLSGFLGARKVSGEAVAPRPGKVLPSRPLGLDKIAAADVDLDFSAADISNSGLPLEAASGRLRIEDRLVTLAPLKLGLARGRVEGRLELETRGQLPVARLDLLATRLHLHDLMPVEDAKKLTSGTLGGRAKLVMRGNSVAGLLGSADGDLALAMSGGSTSRLLVRLANLDVANALVTWLAGGQKEDIRCVVVDFQAREGVLQARSLLADTVKMRLVGEGHISLKDETLALRLHAAGKGGSLLALRGPLRLEGSFANPSVTPEPLPLGE